MSSCNGNDETSQQEHYLHDFLQERLPQLGLDFDLYGPYLMTEDTDIADDSDEWEAVLELLRTSSETHSDDEQVWLTLKQDIQKLQEEHRLQVQQRQQEQHKKHLVEEHERLQHEIALAQKQQQQQLEQQHDSSKQQAEMDAQKRALVERYAYDDSELYNEQGEVVATVATADEPEPPTNKQVAAQAQSAKSKELRAKSQTSKKAEREATAKQKMEKSRIKEERRKRATKGERRR